MFGSRSTDPQDPHFRELIGAIRQQLFGPDDLPGEVRFRDIEDAAHQAGRALARELCRQAAATQAASAARPRPCPDCGRDCPGAVSTRALVTRDGPIDLAEAEHTCPRCRRAFFPQPTGPGAEPPPLQPQGHRRPGRRRRRRLV